MHQKETISQVDGWRNLTCYKSLVTAEQAEKFCGAEDPFDNVHSPCKHIT